VSSVEYSQLVLGNYKMATRAAKNKRAPRVLARRSKPNSSKYRRIVRQFHLLKREMWGFLLFKLFYRKYVQPVGIDAFTANPVRYVEEEAEQDGEE